MTEREGESYYPRIHKYPDEIKGDKDAKIVFEASVEGVKNVLGENFPEAEWRHSVQVQVIQGIRMLSKKYDRGSKDPEEAKKYWRQQVFKEAVFPYQVHERLANTILRDWEEYASGEDEGF